MTDRRHREDYKLSVADWPAADVLAWHQACHPLPGPFSSHQPRSPATYKKYADGYGIYLWYLQRQGLLDATEPPAERVTLERLGGYFAMLQQRGNADHTILGRFDELRGALRLIDPKGDFSFITRPQNISIRQMLPMRRAIRFVPDAREAVLWAKALFDEALSLADPEQRQQQVRDAAIIGIFASRGPRFRAVAGMRLGQHLIRSGETWELFFDKTLMKGGKQELTLANDPRVAIILERYVAVERQELLQGQICDAVWISSQGGPLSYKGIESMLNRRTTQHYGIAIGPHRFRSSLITTAAVVDGTNSLGPALVLGHSPQTALKSYNRANNLEATRQHDSRTSQAEDAAAEMLRRGQARVDKPEPVQSLLELHHRNCKPSPQLDLFGPGA